MTQIRQFLFFALLFFIKGQVIGEPEVFSPTQDQHFNMVIQGNNRFAFALLKQLNPHRANLVFSPYSIASCLAKASIGAKKDTANEFQQVFTYPSSFAAVMGAMDQSLTVSFPKQTTQVWMSNLVWLQDELPLVPAFQYALQRNFSSNVERVNFKFGLVNAAKLINQTISKQTNNHIHLLLNTQDVTEDTQFILTTAFYMRGAWENPFEIKQTVKKPFSFSEQQARQSYFMQTVGTFRTLVEETFFLVDIPYTRQDKGLSLSMIILLPKEKTNWQTVLAQLNEENWQKWIKKMTLQTVQLSLPRFRVDDRLDLNSALKALGMKKTFSADADFSGISEIEGLKLHKVVHKTLIKVDEKGSDASGVVRLRQAVPDVDLQEQKIEISVDHPFFFFIVDHRTQSILLAGIINQP